jgi:hypothetical protein
MVRNFGILNRVFRRPTRSDQYKAGPGEVILTMMDTTSKGPSNNITATTAKPRSNIRFISSTRFRRTTHTFINKNIFDVSTFTRTIMLANPNRAQLIFLSTPAPPIKRKMPTTTGQLWGVNEEYCQYARQHRDLIWRLLQTLILCNDRHPCTERNSSILFCTNRANRSDLLHCLATALKRKITHPS